MSKLLQQLKDETIKDLLNENNQLRLKNYKLQESFVQVNENRNEWVNMMNKKLVEENKQLRQAVNELRQALTIKQKIWTNEDSI